MLEALTLIALLAAPPSDASPNVVMILADDQSYRDFGFMGNDLVHTPNLDRLAARSAIYPNGYVPMSVCRPSLATILTGLYPHQHGVHFNHPPPGLKTMRSMSAADYRAARRKAEHLVGDRPTIPRLLAEAGYVSFQAGKHWEGDFRNAGFTHGMTTALPAPKEDWTLGTRPQTNGQLVAHGNGDLGLAIGRRTMEPIADFVDEYAGRQPFLVWYAPFLPHTPFDAGPEFHQPYESKDVPRHLLPYYAEIARFDASVGTLMQIIDAKSLTDETIFVFICDNGFQPDQRHEARADDRSKWSVDEDGLRTPILIASPRDVEPHAHNELVQAVDLLPTVLDAVGQTQRIPDDLPGISLWQSAVGNESLPDRAAFGAIYPNDAKRLGAPEDRVRARWVRDGDWKLVVPGTSQPLEPALYNVVNDPDEEQNLVDDTTYASQRASLHQRLADWWTPHDSPERSLP